MGSEACLTPTGPAIHPRPLPIHAPNSRRVYENYSHDGISPGPDSLKSGSLKNLRRCPQFDYELTRTVNQASLMLRRAHSQASAFRNLMVPLIARSRGRPPATPAEPVHLPRLFDPADIGCLLVAKLVPHD